MSAPGREVPIDPAHAALLIVDVQNYCAHPDGTGSHKLDARQRHYLFDSLRETVLPNLRLLMRMEPGGVYPEHDHPESEECFVLEGVVNVDGQDYRPGDYAIAPAGSRHEIIRSASGSLILLHWNALSAPT